MGVKDERSVEAEQIGYNGKEFEDSFGLNMYEYGARSYDPTLGRFVNVDKLGESYYETTPYAYANNNPIYFIDPDGNTIKIYYSINGQIKSYNYKYEANRDYSQFSGFLLDAIFMLDNIYQAATIDPNSGSDVNSGTRGGGESSGGGGSSVNIIQNLIDSPKELGIVSSDNRVHSFLPTVRYDPGNPNLNNGGNKDAIGLIRFDPRYGVMFDDIKNTESQVLKMTYDSGVIPSYFKINSPTSLTGHELSHAFNFLKNPSEYRARVANKNFIQDGINFKNQEEAKATSMSRQINLNLGENARLNYQGIPVPVINVLSNQLKK